MSSVLGPFTQHVEPASESLGCAMCGACCNPVRLPKPKEVHLKGDEITLAFARKYWHELKPDQSGHARYACDKYDAVNRTCTAHDERPPVCSGFPWYGKGPNTSMRTASHVDRGPGNVKLHCSFMREVPPGWRPPGSHPLIPIMAVTS